MKLIEHFRRHNTDAAVVSMTWCNDEKKPVQGDEDFAFNRVELEDGTIYFLPVDQVNASAAAGFVPRMAG